MKTIISADVDECSGAQHNCNVNATCNNTIGTFICTCNPGYEGDGVNCTSETNIVIVFFYCY